MNKPYLKPEATVLDFTLLETIADETDLGGGNPLGSGSFNPNNPFPNPFG